MDNINETNTLLEQIRTCVAYDLIGLPFEHMSPVQRIRYEKQCNRLFEACMINVSDQEYIFERYDSIRTNPQKGGLSDLSDSGKGYL